LLKPYRGYYAATPRREQVFSPRGRKPSFKDQAGVLAFAAPLVYDRGATKSPCAA
jgi:hypothetical protein